MPFNIASSAHSRRSLSDLPNISIALAEELKRVGVYSPDELRRLGAEEAWQRLNAAGYRDCVSTALALEGAIRDQPWKELAPDRKMALVHFVMQVANAKPVHSSLHARAA